VDGTEPFRQALEVQAVHALELGHPLEGAVDGHEVGVEAPGEGDELGVHLVTLGHVVVEDVDGVAGELADGFEDLEPPPAAAAARGRRGRRASSPMSATAWSSSSTKRGTSRVDRTNPARATARRRPSMMALVSMRAASPSAGRPGTRAWRPAMRMSSLLRRTP